MSNIQTILNALMDQVTPNTSAEHAEDNYRKKYHHLRMLIDQRLMGEPAAKDLVKKYLEVPSVWESNLADILVKLDVHNDFEVVEAAEDVLASTNLYEPGPIDEGPPSSIPGILEDIE